MKRFRQRFIDPALEAEQDALDRIEQIAWEAYDDGRKAPRTVKAEVVSKMRAGELQQGDHDLKRPRPK